MSKRRFFSLPKKVQILRILDRIYVVQIASVLLPGVGFQVGFQVKSVSKIWQPYPLDSELDGSGRGFGFFAK